MQFFTIQKKKQITINVNSTRNFVWKELHFCGDESIRREGYSQCEKKVLWKIVRTNHWWKATFGNVQNKRGEKHTKTTAFKTDGIRSWNSCLSTFKHTQNAAMCVIIFLSFCVYDIWVSEENAYGNSIAYFAFNSCLFFWYSFVQRYNKIKHEIWEQLEWCDWLCMTQNAMNRFQKWAPAAPTTTTTAFCLKWMHLSLVFTYVEIMEN